LAGDDDYLRDATSINHQVALRANFKIYSRSAKGGQRPVKKKLICDIFNLEALTVNQVKSFKALADGKDVFIGTKTGSGILGRNFNQPPGGIAREFQNIF
jgi:hypothetical protein